MHVSVLVHVFAEKLLEHQELFEKDYGDVGKWTRRKHESQQRSHCYTICQCFTVCTRYRS